MGCVSKCPFLELDLVGNLLLHISMMTRVKFVFILGGGNRNWPCWVNLDCCIPLGQRDKTSVRDKVFASPITTQSNSKSNHLSRDILLHGTDYRDIPQSLLSLLGTDTSMACILTLIGTDRDLIIVAVLMKALMGLVPLKILRSDAPPEGVLSQESRVQEGRGSLASRGARLNFPLSIRKLAEDHIKNVLSSGSKFDSVILWHSKNANFYGLVVIRIRKVVSLKKFDPSP